MHHGATKTLHAPSVWPQLWLPTLAAYYLTSCLVWLPTIWPLVGGHLESRFLRLLPGTCIVLSNPRLHYRLLTLCPGAYCQVHPLCSATCAFKGHVLHESYCRAQASLYDKARDNTIEFACSNGLNSLKVCHEYLDLKHLASGKPKGKAQPTPLAPAMQDNGRGGLASGSRASVSSALRSGTSSVGMHSYSTSVAPSQVAKRAPPRQPAPAFTDDREVERAFASAAAARMSFTRPLSMSVENRGGGTWGGVEAAPPPAGPAGGASLFDMEGERLFEQERNPAKLLEAPELVIDGKAPAQHATLLLSPRAMQCGAV